MQLLLFTDESDTVEPEQTLQERLLSSLQSLLPAMAMEYAHKWKMTISPQGMQIPTITASGHRTSGSGSTGEPSGYPTPVANEFEPKDLEAMDRRRRECKERTGNGNGFGLTLGMTVAGFPTPAAQNADGGVNPQGNTGEHFTLQTAAGLFSGYPTCQAADTGTPRAPRLKAEKRDATSTGARDPDCIGNYRMDLKDLPFICDETTLAGYGTPRVTTNDGSWNPDRAKQARLEDQVAGYNTPQARDWKGESSSEEFIQQRIAHLRGKNLSFQATLLTGYATPMAADDGHKVTAASKFGLIPQTAGLISQSANSATANRGVLNQVFSLWLMAYPVGPAIHGWDRYAPGYSEWESVQGILRKLSSGPGSTEPES